MEKVTCVALYNARIKVKSADESKKGYIDLGLFTLKKDAFLAIEAYKQIVSASKLDDVVPCEQYSIGRKLVPEAEMNVKYYNNVQEFIKDKSLLVECEKKIGKDRINKILVDIGIKMDPAHERIIGAITSRLVVDAKLAEGTIEYPGIKEGIKTLDALLNGKI